jgi:phage baseplate assembly protein W
MADGRTYGVNFPFKDSDVGYYLDLSEFSDEEIRSNLIHLLLTRKGSRYFLPDFGTRLYEYIFEPLDGPTFSGIEDEIRETGYKYIPKLIINRIQIKPATEDTGDGMTNDPNLIPTTDRVYAIGVKEYTAVIRIDFTINDGVFGKKDFVIINI